MPSKELEGFSLHFNYDIISAVLRTVKIKDGMNTNKRKDRKVNQL